MVAEADIDPPPALPMARDKVLRGRLADPRRAEEVTINERLGDLLDVDVGDRITVSLYSADQLGQVGNGRSPAPLAVVSERVVG